MSEDKKLIVVVELQPKPHVIKWPKAKRKTWPQVIKMKNKLKEEK